MHMESETFQAFSYIRLGGHPVMLSCVSYQFYSFACHGWARGFI